MRNVTEALFGRSMGMTKTVPCGRRTILKNILYRDCTRRSGAENEMCPLYPLLCL